MQVQMTINGERHQADVEPRLAHGLERVVDVRSGLPVHDDRVGPGAREVLDPALGALDHEVDVERAAAVVHQIPERVDDQRPDRDGRHEVAIHHVHVNHTRAGVHHCLHLVAQTGEVGRQDGWRDPYVLK